MCSSAPPRSQRRQRSLEPYGAQGSQLVATDRKNGWAPRTAQASETVAVGCDPLPESFHGAPDPEFRAATKALELENSALSHQRVPPGYRFPYGHTHTKQEEVYVVLRGSGRMKSTSRSSSLRVELK
jgi:mannose-6-phosphate isomerase-like protein (cupin superfamily)